MADVLAGRVLAEHTLTHFIQRAMREVVVDRVALHTADLHPPVLRAREKM